MRHTPGVWSDLDPKTSALLGPGSYILHLSAPDWVLALFLGYNTVGLDIAERVLSQSHGRVRVVSGGVQHDIKPGTNIQRRLLVIQFEILGDDQLQVIEGGIPAPVYVVASLVALFASALAIRSGLLGVERIMTSAPGAAIEDGAAAAKNASNAFKWLVWGGLAYGGYVLVNRAGGVRKLLGVKS